ncbi:MULTISPECIES: hypothetical protein [unclassified Rhizobium]|uniref:hypothetical protein n=1 Tax=unclassified Rhizobium TaxID=2613769 RepID=UPI001ADAD5B1|nr:MULTISPECIES: hypothetical protein [unclassified Rhizobium]MBO9122955.1 hypothetical protein [Rhizobium sp. 16-488-2b]MBO9173487.1 hypothetical protein [Rhizobium sp. 16-488-2a]
MIGGGISGHHGGRGFRPLQSTATLATENLKLFKSARQLVAVYWLQALNSRGFNPFDASSPHTIIAQVVGLFSLA